MSPIILNFTDLLLIIFNLKLKNEINFCSLRRYNIGRTMPLLNTVIKDLSNEVLRDPHFNEKKINNYFITLKQATSPFRILFKKFAFESKIRPILGFW